MRFRPHTSFAGRANELEARLASGSHNALHIPGALVEIDTTATVDVAALIALARTLSG